MSQESKDIETKRVKAIFAQAVKSAIGGDRKHGWGAKDSLEVIETLIAESTKEIASEGGATPAMMDAFAKVVNPSACRQWLESDKVGLLDKSETKAKAKSDWFADAV